MPGLVGIVTKAPQQGAHAELARMVKTLHHESFYVCGTWADESLGVYVGWVERQDSSRRFRPLVNERGDVTLVFSGTDYAGPETASRLKPRHEALGVDGPEYLLGLYEDDPAFPQNLNGMFQVLVVDRRDASATLFNDRYGMQRIYYYETKEAFYFSAEAKAILALHPETRVISPTGLGEFISLGCVLENRTLFEGIQLVPPAAAWTFRNGSLERKGTYFQPQEWEAQEPLDPESYYRELRGVFSETSLTTSLGPNE